MKIKTNKLKILLAVSAFVIALTVVFFYRDSGKVGVDWSKTNFKCSACETIFSLSAKDIKGHFSTGNFISVDSLVVPCPKCGQSSSMVRICPNCQHTYPASASQCPACDWSIADELRKRHIK